MTLGVRGKLFAISLLLIFSVGLVSFAYLEHALRSWLEARIEATLSSYALTVRDVVEMAVDDPKRGTVDRVADRLGGSTGARVTVIASDGRVLGDSELGPAELEQVEDHGQRPEIRDALAHGKGASRRYSTTIDTDMMYLAVPVALKDERGVVRVAMPLSSVDAVIGRLRVLLVIAALLGIAVAVLMSGLASHLFSRTLRSLLDDARAITAGQRDVRLPLSSTDEIATLAGSFNRLADELNQTVRLLAHERERLEALLEDMSEAVIAVDADQQVVLANRAATNLLKLPRSPEGRSLLEVLRAPALTEIVARAKRGEAASVEFELRDPLRTLLARASPLKSTGGVVVVLHDVTEARRLDAVRRDFVANVSHELRTPVSVIRANTETLLDGALADPARQRQFISAIHRNSERLSRLITDLLDLSRIEAGKSGLVLAPVELASVVDKVVEGLRPAAGAERVTLAARVDPDLWARADERALEQVLFNLLDNALKYAGSGGAVEVRAVAGGDTVRIEVEDGGPGVAPEHRDRIFERFYRVDTGRSQEMGGTGLGLSIVKHLVGAMGGEAGVLPGSPKGAIFWFTLPRAADAPLAAAGTR